MYRFFMERNNLRDPKKLAQKIIYLCMVIVSINLSANWLATSTVRLLETQKELASFDDIVKLNLSIHSISISFRNFYKENQKKLGYPLSEEVKLFSGTDEIINCMDDVVKNRNVCCLVTEELLIFYLHLKFKDKNEIPALKILESTLFSSYWSFIYEEASPYVEKMSSIVREISDSGIGDLDFRFQFKSGVRLLKKLYQPTLTMLKDSLLVTKLAIILATGYTISLGVLTFEILFGKLGKHFNFNKYVFLIILKEFFNQF